MVRHHDPSAVLPCMRGIEDLFVAFGNLVINRKYVMVEAIICNRSLQSAPASFRTPFDFPHITVAKLSPLQKGVVNYGQPPGKEGFGNRCNPLGRLTGWLDGRLAGCPGNRPAGWLAGRPATRPGRKPAGWLAGRPGSHLRRPGCCFLA